MANRPLRPWHRFASLPRQTAPPTAHTVIPSTVETQEPLPSALVQPTFTPQTTQPSFAPTLPPPAAAVPPPPPPAAVTPPPVVTQPITPVVTTTTVTDGARSPKFKPSTDSAPPPPSFSLPPARQELKSQAEPEATIPLVSEPKTVLFQKTVDRPLDHSDKQTQKPRFTAQDAKEEWRKELEADKHKDTIHKKLSDSEHEVLGKRFITITGENKGAFMEVVRAPNKLGGQDKSPVLHKSGLRVVEPNGVEQEYIKNEEGKKDKNGKKGKRTHSFPLTTFTNNNVQGVNHSIVFNSSFNHNDPGVHYVFSRKPVAGYDKGIQVKDRSSDHQG